MEKYFKDSTYPRNFILIGTQLDEMKNKANAIVAEAEKKCKEIFNSEDSSFAFDLRYVPPFDKNFGELMRLQGVAAEHVRFKDGYKGYIILDVSEFIKHEKESYFLRAIKYLHDENENWRYIFIVDKSNEKAARDMVQAILEFIEHTKVLDDENVSDNNQRFLKTICKERKVKLDEESFKFIENLLTKEKINRNVIETIVCDLSAMCDNSVVTAADIKEYFEGDTAIVRYMVSKSDFDRILMLCNDLKMKGREHD